MRKEIKKAPTIRFRGFTDDWEQRKLGDIIDSYSGGTPSVGNTAYYGGNIPFIRSAEIDNESTELFLTEDGLSNSSAKMVSKGDILYALYGATSGEVGIAKLDGAINQAILAILPHEGYDAQFIMQRLKRSKASIISTYLQGGQGNLSGTIVKNLIINTPSYVEQVRMGEYFFDLDNLIALHQRKLEQQKNLKKYFLQNMFPAKGEKAPRIRFKGFTGDWEQRKLGNISAFITKGSTPTTYGYHWGDYGIPFFRNDSIQENTFVYGNYSYISNEANDALKRSEITAKDILIAITGEIGKVGIVPDNIKKANINQHMARVRISKEAVPYFVYQYLATGKIQNEYQKIKTGLSMPQLSLEQIRNTTILLPCYEEQFKISDYLSGLDNLITLHQRKLNQLLTMKKFMLQNLFI